MTRQAGLCCTWPDTQIVCFLMWGLISFLGYYFTGDGAYRSEEGHYQITGRMDDVLNVSGHRLGTAEIEDAIVRHSLLC